MGVGHVLAAVVGTILGLLVGSSLWHRREETPQLPTPGADSDHEPVLPSRADDRQRLAALQRELRCERSLLDGVASSNGVSPRAFREALARDYLHEADPYRSRYLDPPVDVEISDLEVAETGLDPLPPAVGAPLPPDGRTQREIERLTERLDEKERALAATRLAIADLRQEVEALMAVEPVPAALSRPPDQVIDLREEVAGLRSRLADRVIDADRLGAEVKRLGDRDRELDLIIDQLGELHRRLISTRSSDGHRDGSAAGHPTGFDG